MLKTIIIYLNFSQIFFKFYSFLSLLIKNETKARMRKMKVKKKNIHKDVISYHNLLQRFKSLERGVKLTYTTFTLVPP